MTLTERIHVRMLEDKTTRRRLYGIPPAVVEDVLTLGIRALSEIVPLSTPASELGAIEFEACEACGHLVDPERLEGAQYGGEDGTWLCNACAVEAGAAEP